MMTKFNVGDKVRIIDTLGACLCGYQVGDIATVYSMNHDGTCTTRLKHDGNGIRGFGDYGVHFELIGNKPKKSARITALETQVAALEAKVEALEKAGKYPLTEQFERESAEVDSIMTDIKRKAKPTLESILATYPTPNEQRADVIKRAKAFVAENEKRKLPKGQNAEFIVNADKRTVVALIHRDYSYYTRIIRKGIAKCDPDDVFNADIGKAIALARALGVEVPAEFVKAVQPTEYFKGTVIRLINGERYQCEFSHKITPKGEVILDDTDAVYE